MRFLVIVYYGSAQGAATASGPGVAKGLCENKERQTHLGEAFLCAHRDGDGDGDEKLHRPCHLSHR